VIAGQRGQSLVEFGLIAPLFFLIIFLSIDFARLAYTYTAISAAARDGAREISLSSDQATDCTAIAKIEQVGQGFPLKIDPHSVVGNTDPNGPANATLGPQAPPDGIGYAYIWPSASSAVPQESNCTTGGPRPVSQTTHDVDVEIQYHFVPMTPLVSYVFPAVIVKTISVVHTEY
jgi:Flp pilus assembly protein TadG